MMNWIYSALVGIVTGYIARLLLPGHDDIGVLMTMLVGIVGAFVGTAIGHATGNIQKDAKAGWLFSILGSILVLVAMRILF
ncbi:MAG: GlsB/YeaQ/YmgE family stress response membrane protein [Bryobacteraceae bacterium]